jgi:hypothetical protein
MSYEVTVLADSVSSEDIRLTTLEVVFPRFILAEGNTHRALSRNSASSRAIPTEVFLESIEKNPFVPSFNQRVKGMGVGDAFNPLQQFFAETTWLRARDDAMRAARSLMDQGVDKSRANRLLEPFMWHTAIISATEWSNFFALRAPEGDEVDLDFPAQPELQQIAIMMREAMRKSIPTHLDRGQWHIPLVDWDTQCQIGIADSKKVSVGLLARRSSYNRKDPEPIEKSIERHDILAKSGHWSPFEHVATPALAYRPSNFVGWNQYRTYFENQDDAGRNR